MLKKRGKKKIAIALIILLGIIAIVTMTIKVKAMMNAGSGDLGCSSLTSCRGAASCGEPGTSDSCDIYCKSGPIISCPAAN